MSFRRLFAGMSALMLFAGGGMPVSAAQKKSIVLVHGAFVDGSGWQGVYQILKRDGYNVVVVQNATITLADDVAATRRAIDGAGGDVILVGHSYGGAVVTQAGNDPKVIGLVYIAAFVPDKGESVGALIKHPAPGAPMPPILPPQNGFLMLDRSKFSEAFAADVNSEVANFMANSQVPWGLESLSETITEPAWKTKPSWYLLTTEDRMIPPATQRFMAERAKAKIAEVASSHAVYVSKPDVVARFIEQAASH
jgi:pimeloyl-ACP methyl ester carboxylesterase